MIVPRHDRLRGPRVLVTEGAVNRVTPQLLAAELSRFPALAALKRPIVGLLIGGANAAYRLDAQRLAEIADRIAAAVTRRGGSLVATPSRRTGPDGVALLRERLAGVPGQMWDGRGENPYYAYPRRRRRADCHGRFGVDGQRGRRHRQAGAYRRSARRRREIRAISRGDARGRHHAAVRRRNRGLALSSARRHGAGRGGAARPCHRAVHCTGNTPHETRGPVRRNMAAARSPVPVRPGDRPCRNRALLYARPGISASRLGAARRGRGHGPVDHEADHRNHRGRRALAGADRPSAVASRPQGARLHRCRNGPRSGADRQYRAERPLGSRAAVANRGVRWHAPVHPGAAAGIAVRAQLRLCLGSRRAGVFRRELRLAAPFRSAQTRSRSRPRSDLARWSASCGWPPGRISCPMSFMPG